MCITTVALSARQLGTIVASAVMLVAATSWVGEGMPIERVRTALTEVSSYRHQQPDDEERATSVGARFEAWRSALGAFRSDPILGVGWGNLRERFEQDAARGVRHPTIADFDHAHSQFIGALGSGGIIGLSAIGALFAAPGWVFLRAWSSRDDRESSVGLVGVLVVSSYVVVSLTEAIAERWLPITFYAVTVTALVGYLGTREIIHTDRVIDLRDTEPLRSPLQSLPAPPDLRRN